MKISTEPRRLLRGALANSSNNATPQASITLSVFVSATRQTEFDFSSLLMPSSESCTKFFPALVHSGSFEPIDPCEGGFS